MEKVVNKLKEKLIFYFTVNFMNGDFIPLVPGVH